MEYISFHLTVERDQAAQTCRVAARGALAGEARGEFDLADLRHSLSLCARSSDVGRTLFQFAFSGGIARSYAASRTCLRESQALRLDLEITDSEVAALPWELLYDTAVSYNFMALSLYTPVVRYLPAPLPNRPLVVKGPLRVLLVLAAPKDLSPLDIRREQEIVRTALGPLSKEGQITLTCIEQATITSLREQLRQEPHVLHFVGHGGFDGRQGVLSLVDSSMRAVMLGAEELAVLLADTQVRLAVLNACDTGFPGYGGNIWSIGSRLVRAGIPVAVGLRGQVSDQDAQAFAGEFYSSVSTGLPVEAALTEGRRLSHETVRH